MARPLMQHGVGQLEEMFAKGKSDSKVLEQLEHELQFRQVRKAIALLTKVRAAMNAAPDSTQRSATAPARPPQQPSLWEHPSAPTVVASSIAETVRSSTGVIKPSVALAEPLQPAPAIPLNDAYKILKTTPGATWESVEQTRRQLVQLSHPLRLKSLSVERRAQALAEAKLVNAACVVLWRSR